MGIACFLIKQGPQAKRSLRRFHHAGEGEECCPGTERSYHTASVEIGTVPLVLAEHGTIASIDPAEYAGDERWPTTCEKCGYVFPEEDPWQVNQDPIYRAEDGREMTLHEAPPGAIWVATWMPENWRVNGGTGPAYIIKLPNGHDFIPGSQASNCDRAGEDHDCWCVHGEAPTLTIDKNPEPGRSTCSAGGGSIWSNQGKPNEWHGFVTTGELVG
jgi:hypothetical protein